MTAVATIPERSARPVPAIVQMLDDHTGRLAPLLPSGVTIERVKSELYFAAQKTPAILECTPDSILQGVAKAIARDLTIGETVHLVPTNENYKDANGKWQKRKVLVVMNDYKGDIELVLRSGAARSIKLSPVFANEEFDTWTDEQGDHLMHRPAKDAAARGMLVGAYGIANLGPRVPPLVRWMTLGEIEVVRAKSKSWAPTDDGKNKDCPPWYAVKTVAHAITKALPKNPRLSLLLREMEVELGLEETPTATATAQLVAGDVPSAAAEADAVAEPVTASHETGEDATDAQREFLANMLRSHVWTEDEKAKVLAKAAGATKIGMSDIIDRTNTELKRRKQAEAEADALQRAEADAAAARTKATEDLF